MSTQNCDGMSFEESLRAIKPASSESFLARKIQENAELLSHLITDLRVQNATLLDAAKELHAAYEARDQESAIKWLNGKFAALKAAIDEVEK